MIKTLIFLKTSCTALALLIIVSCSTSKKMALPCPQPENRYKSKVTLNCPHNTKKFHNTSYRNKKFNFAFGNSSYKQKIKRTIPISDYLKHKPSVLPAEQSWYQKSPSRTEYLTNFHASEETQASVNKAILTSEIESMDKLADFQADETVLQRVDIMPKGSINSETNNHNYSKTSIRPSITSFTKTVPQESKGLVKKKRGLSVTGLAFSIAGLIITGIPSLIALLVVIRLNFVGVGLILAGIPLGAIAIILSALALSKTRKNPDRYSGKGLALAGLIIGSIDIIAVLITLAILITMIMF